MNKQKLTSDIVLQTAEVLIKVHGSTTTLDVKRAIRTEGTYEAFQGEVSRLMQDLYGAGKLTSSNDASLPYQIYSLPAAAAGGAQVSTNALTDKASLIRDLMANSSNPAISAILLELTTKATITRQEIMEKIKDSSDPTRDRGEVTDQALKTLLNKKIIVRTGRGQYAAPRNAPAIGSTPAATMPDDTQPIPSLDDTQKLTAALEVIEELKAENTKLKEAVAGVKTLIESL